jgi:competence protein ComEA
MRHLVWKKQKRQADDYGRGLLVLLVIMVAASSLKTTLAVPATKGDLSNGKIFIAIEGEIRDNGVYAFNREVNLEELIERGGGLKNCDNIPDRFSNIPLGTGSRVNVNKSGDEWVFFQEEISAFNKVTLGIPISLNRETEHGLTAIPGIGPVLAEKIVNARTEREGFQNLNEVKSISGVGDKLYISIISYVELF